MGSTVIGGRARSYCTVDSRVLVVGHIPPSALATVLLVFIPIEEFDKELFMLGRE